MSKKVPIGGWYTTTRIDKFDVAYKIIIGKRSNGKTYAIKKICIDDIVQHNGRFMYIRRRHSQITRKLMVKLFQDINEYAREQLGTYINYTTERGFYLEPTVKNGEAVSVGWATSIEDCYNIKGVPFNEITTIFFDEFLEYGSAIEDELSRFVNVISSIVRTRDDVQIYMVANTITKFSPYYELFGIDANKLKQGKIAYVKHSNGATAAVEYCSSGRAERRKLSESDDPDDDLKNKYLGFDDNPTSNMILYGEWEYDAVNVHDIDGITWNTERQIIPMYFTASGIVYELSMYIGKNPVAFVRTLNTQNGFVKKEIRYNLSYDNSLRLCSVNGVVPTYGKISTLMDERITNMFGIFMKAIEAKRVVFDKMATGSDFLKLIKVVI